MKHCFEIHTAQVEYYVGEEHGSGDCGAHITKSWEMAIRQALMPVTTPNGQRFKNFLGPDWHNFEQARKWRDLTASISVSASDSNDSEDKVTDMSQLYQIFPDEVLGSGQFGIVYGGTFWTTMVLGSLFIMEMFLLLKKIKIPIPSLIIRTFIF